MSVQGIGLIYAGYIKCIEYFLLETCISKHRLDTPLQGQRQALGIVF